MAISVGDAVLRLGVDTKDLDKGMQGIGNTIKKHQKAIGIGMVAAGGAILAAGALSIKTFAEMGDEVQKMALKTGFSTEALSELRHAAEISGTSIQGIEKGVKRMASTLLDAEMGLATSVDALKELNLTVDDFKGLSPEEAFIKFMEAIADVEDPLNRTYSGSPALTCCLLWLVVLKDWPTSVKRLMTSASFSTKKPPTKQPNLTML